MQDIQKVNTTKIDKTSATLEQITYDNRTQSTQIEQLQTKTMDHSRQIDKLNQTIIDRNIQLSALRGKLKEFDKCKQTYDTNIALILPLSTSIVSLQNTMDKMTTGMQKVQCLGPHRWLKATEERVKAMSELATDTFLDSSISNHLETLVKRTNSHINTIDDVTSTKLQLMEGDSLTMASMLDFAFQAKTTLQAKIENSQQQCDNFKAMEEKFAAKWPDFNTNATTLLGASRDLEKIKDSVCTADIWQTNCQGDRDSADTIKKLMKNCQFSKKTVTSHTSKVQEMYDALVHKNEPNGHKNDARDDKNECSPPLQDRPNNQGLPQSKFYGTHNSQSRPNGNPNGYKDSNNGYTHPSNAPQKTSQLHQSQNLRPSQTYR